MEEPAGLDRVALCFFFNPPRYLVEQRMSDILKSFISFHDDANRVEEGDNTNAACAMCLG